MRWTPNKGGAEVYRIVRYYQSLDCLGGKEVIAQGLTLDEARAHCSNPDTKGVGWFDGYEEE